MPRQWEPKEGVSPFADYLVQRMRAHTPPIRPHHLAQALGVQSAVISQWFRKGSIPRAPLLVRLADVFGDPVATWYEAAAGMPPSPSPACDAAPGSAPPTGAGTAAAAGTDAGGPETATPRRSSAALWLGRNPGWWNGMVETTLSMPNWSRKKKAFMVRRTRELQASFEVMRLGTLSTDGDLPDECADEDDAEDDGDQKGEG